MSGRYVVPDAIEPVEGWKAWQPYGIGTLLSPLYISAWPWREPLQASCSFTEGHALPHEQCSCGIYIAKDIRTLVSFGVETIGKVYGWGKVIEHERGWRVQFCYPKEIYTTHTHETAFSGYGVPVYRGFSLSDIVQDAPWQWWLGEPVA